MDVDAAGIAGGVGWTVTTFSGTGRAGMRMGCGRVDMLSTCAGAGIVGWFEAIREVLIVDGDEEMCRSSMM